MEEVRDRAADIGRYESLKGRSSGIRLRRIRDPDRVGSSRQCVHPALETVGQRRGTGPEVGAEYFARNALLPICRLAETKQNKGN